MYIFNFFVRIVFVDYVYFNCNQIKKICVINFLKRCIYVEIIYCQGDFVCCCYYDDDYQENDGVNFVFFGFIVLFFFVVGINMVYD